MLNLGDKIKLSNRYQVLHTDYVGVIQADRQSGEALIKQGQYLCKSQPWPFLFTVPDPRCGVVHMALKSIASY